MIEIKNINKSFGSNHVLKDVSFNFEAGKTNLIIGASGSGKTTLIKCMVGLHQQDSGSISFDGRDFILLDKKEQRVLRQDIGMLFQGGALFDYLTVKQNISFGLDMFTTMSQKEKDDRIAFCLNRVNLSNANNLYPSELSGGMIKRVAIARAIALKPKYLFCDEPNSGLDPQTAIIIDNLIQEITQEYNITTVVNTHDMNSVMEIGDNIAFISEGELAWSGDKKSIMSSDCQVLNDFVFASQLFKKLKQ
jgi:phospholipid/cholesterol/gamma-HCH transport system ATP-binding protein|tara:strand:- start:302 stop:1048 length:747 start_codon:yes stop_codon:yes gene_type:complete